MAVITYLRVIRDLLISILSFVTTLPVYDYRSEPAKSTSYNVDVTILSGFLESTHSIVSFNIVCERLLALFMLCEATTLFFRPKWYKANTSSSVRHSNVYRFSTVKMSLTNLSFKPGSSPTRRFILLLFKRS